MNMKRTLKLNLYTRRRSCWNIQCCGPDRGLEATFKLNFKPNWMQLDGILTCMCICVLRMEFSYIDHGGPTWWLGTHTCDVLGGVWWGRDLPPVAARHHFRCPGQRLSPTDTMMPRSSTRSDIWPRSLEEIRLIREGGGEGGHTPHHRMV